MPEMSPAEAHLSLGMRAVGAALVFGLAPLLYVLRHGYLWQPNQYEYEWMILVTYVSLGIALYAGASDIRGADMLLTWAIYGGFFSHATVMLVETFMDWRQEWEHVMPYGDVTVLYASGALLLVLKRRYDAEQKAQ